MELHLLLTHIAKYTELTPQEEDLLMESVHEKKLNQKQFLFREGDIHKGQAFVTKGCLRAYTIDNNGFEHIIQFAPEGWWIADIQSILNQTGGKLNIEAVEHSELLFLYKNDIDKLLTQIPKLERYFRLLLERSLASYQNRIIDNLSLNAKERYTSFCQYYPSLIQRLPQKHIAAYIGVTPEFLSKMLNRKMDVAI